MTFGMTLYDVLDDVLKMLGSFLILHLSIFWVTCRMKDDALDDFGTFECRRILKFYN